MTKSKIFALFDVFVVQVVKIPSERIRALMGKDRSTITALERRCKVKINASADGAVEIEGESVDEFFSKDVVKAIGRGFDPNTALKLLRDEYTFKIINLRDFFNSPEAIARVKSRVIGTEGKTKKIIEAEAECDLSVYGYTISVIAHLETIDLAVNAIMKLIDGSNHATVYAYLEKARTRLKQDRMKQAYGL